MKAIVRHENEVIATVQTNRSMSIEDVLEIVGVDINEMEDENTPKYNYDALRLEIEAE